MARDPNKMLTLADELQLLTRIMPEEQAKARLYRAFSLSGRSMYSPKFAVSYEGCLIDFDTGRVTLRRLPRQPFTPIRTAAEFFEHFPEALSTAAPTADAVTPGPAEMSPRPKRRRGPTPGALDRYGESDRALYSELERISHEEKTSITDAAQRLADSGKVSGTGTPKSRAKRLAERYRLERDSHKQP
jgi:hypothetical protein